MTFKLSTASTYNWPVAGELAGARYSFTGQFYFLPQERIDELRIAAARRQALLRSGQDDPELSDVHARAIALELLAGWDGVVDDDGSPIEFSRHQAEKFVQIQGVADAVVLAWTESLQGAKRGNSKAPRGIG